MIVVLLSRLDYGRVNGEEVGCSGRQVFGFALAVVWWRFFSFSLRVLVLLPLLSPLVAASTVGSDHPGSTRRK